MTVPQTTPPAPRPRRRVQGPPGVQCPSCHKLASLDEPEIEDQSFDVGDDEVTATVSIIRNSGCCGDEIKRADLDASMPFDHECSKADDPEAEQGFDDAEGELEPYITGGGRYKASYVGASGTVTVKCLACDEIVEVSFDPGILEIRAGDMDVSV